MSESSSTTESSVAESERYNGLPDKIVVIGGGTGNSTVLRGLTSSPFSGEGVTAVVGTFDDGGGTGHLREVYPALPAVGDVRQCMDAMSDASPVVRKILNRRWKRGDASKKLNLAGQTQGNLIIAGALQAVLEDGGNFSSALEAAGELFKIKGTVVPVSNDIRTLLFTLLNGSIIKGEHTAEETKLPSFMGSEITFNGGPADISEEAEAAIESADMVVIAPGDLYTSIGPNLVVRGMKEALQRATAVVMVLNLMNRNRHTVGFTGPDYLTEYGRLIGDTNVIHSVIYNTAQLDKIALAAQAEKSSHPVKEDVQGLRQAGVRFKGYDLLSGARIEVDPNDPVGPSRSEIRHDPGKIAAALLSLYLGNGL